MKFGIPFVKKKKPAEPAPQGYVPRSIEPAQQMPYQFTGTSLPMATMRPMKRRKPKDDPIKSSKYIPPAFRASASQQKKRGVALMKEQPFAIGWVGGPVFAPIEQPSFGFGGAPPKSVMDKEGKLRKAYYY